MTAVLAVFGIALAVLAGYGSDAAGLPTLGRGLIMGIIVGAIGALVARRVRARG